MTRTKRGRILALLGVLACSGPSWAETLEQRLERMEREIKELRSELRRRDEEDAKRRAAEPQQPASAQGEAPAAGAAPPPAETAKPAEGSGGKGGTLASLREVTDRVRIGGYGSFRYETSSLEDQSNSFVFRRFVLTADAAIAPKLRAMMELEFERFRELELEKASGPEDGGLTVEQTVEGTNQSEISFEQAWLQYDLVDWFKFRGGQVLVPLGRFNINHDDNLWNLPRRPLVDRGVPVLPTKAAWAEVGAGFLGELALGKEALLNYQTYVVNGATLDTEFEQIARTRSPESPESVIEVKFAPTTGTAGLDVKDAKAWTGRLGLSPALGHDVGGSWYWGQYTPDFLAAENLWSVGADGLTTWGPFELEGEFIFTRFGGSKEVARQVAQIAVDSVSETENPDLNTEVEFELSGLAKNKYGYWLEARYRFWPEYLSQTVFGKPFANPTFVAVLRGEQAWLDGLITDLDFAGGVVRSLGTSNRWVNRITPGIAYRPVPLVVFQLAYEFTWTNPGESLSGVTNYLIAQPGESTNHSVMLGAAFGF